MGFSRGAGIRGSLTLPRMNAHRLVIIAAALTMVVAAALATALASAPRALGLTKRELVRNGLGDVAAALAYEAEMQAIAAQTADAAEGIAAFRAKRAPVYHGA